MAKLSLVEKIRLISDLIKSQSFFITLFAILVLIIMVLVINLKKKSKAPKLAVAIIFIGLAILVIARYGKYVLSFNDSIVEKVFKAIYFPNIIVYFAMLITSILLLIAMIIDKKFSTITKITNVVCFFGIWFFFILTLDLIKKSGINFYEVKELYANKSVMTLLQTSMSIFVIWLGIVVMDLIIRKLDNRMSKNANDDLENKVEEEKEEIASTIDPLLFRNNEVNNNPEEYQRYTNYINFDNTNDSKEKEEKAPTIDPFTFMNSEVDNSSLESQNNISTTDFNNTNAAKEEEKTTIDPSALENDEMNNDQEEEKDTNNTSFDNKTEKEKEELNAFIDALISKNDKVDTNDEML